MKKIQQFMSIYIFIARRFPGVMLIIYIRTNITSFRTPEC